MCGLISFTPGYLICNFYESTRDYTRIEDMNRKNYRRSLMNWYCSRANKKGVALTKNQLSATPHSKYIVFEIMYQFNVPTTSDAHLVCPPVLQVKNNVKSVFLCLTDHLFHCCWLQCFSIAYLIVVHNILYCRKIHIRPYINIA